MSQISKFKYPNFYFQISKSQISNLKFKIPISKSQFKIQDIYFQKSFSSCIFLLFYFYFYFILFILFYLLFYLFILFCFILFSLFLFQVFNFKIQFSHFSISFFFVFNFKFTISQFQSSKCYKFQNSNIPISNCKFLNLKSQIYKIQASNFKNLNSKNS